METKPPLMRLRPSIYIIEYCVELSTTVHCWAHLCHPHKNQSTLTPVVKSGPALRHMYPKLATCKAGESMVNVTVSIDSRSTWTVALCCLPISSQLCSVWLWPVVTKPPLINLSRYIHDPSVYSFSFCKGDNSI